MERKLRYIEKEIKKVKIPILDTGDNPDAPAPREMIDLEVRSKVRSRTSLHMNMITRDTCRHQCSHMIMVG